MPSPWERLEGRTPVNKAAYSISRRLPNQENNNAKTLSDLERENIKLKQELTMLKSEMEWMLESKCVILDMLNRAMRACEPYKLIKALGKVDIPDHLLENSDMGIPISGKSR